MTKKEGIINGNEEGTIIDEMSTVGAGTPGMVVGASISMKRGKKDQPESLESSDSRRVRLQNRLLFGATTPEEVTEAGQALARHDLAVKEPDK